jgi:UDP-glucosyl transferase 73C
MASQPHQLHLVLVPIMSPGHIIPIIDIAKILAQRNLVVTRITTPLNAIRFSTTINRAVQSGLSIQILKIQFPYDEAGLPQGCENIHSLPSPNLTKNFLTAISLLQQPFEQLFQELKPTPCCIISDKYLAWTANRADRFHVPRIIFDRTNCFNILCCNNFDAILKTRF